MDIIEIDSSESEDDAGVGHIESQGKAFNNGEVDQSPEGSNHYSHQKKHGIEVDPIFMDKWGIDANFPSHYVQKRNLPLSFRPAILRPASKHCLESHGRPILVPQFGEPEQAGHDNGSKRDLNDLCMDRHQPDDEDAESSQQMQKRSLPSSLKPKVNKTAPDGSHDSVGENPTDHNIYVEGDADGKVDTFCPQKSNDKRRHLPLSLLNGKSVTQPKANVEKRVGDQTLNYHAGSSHSVVGSSVDGVRTLPLSFRNEIRDSKPRVNTSSRDDVQKYQNAGTLRVLPPSLMYGKFGSISQPADASDPGFRSGVGEERQVEHEERVIYREALQNLGLPKLEDDLPEGLMTVPLLKHQKIALAWMVQKEKSVHCAGGILADDQGLGKTISMIALMLRQMTLQAKFTSDSSRHIETEALNLDEDDDGVNEVNKVKHSGKDDLQKKPVASTSMRASHNPRPAAGTLVVCPASVLRQWARELDEKVTDSAKLSVLVYHGGTRPKDPGDLAKYDVVLTTYAIVTNEVPKQTLVDEDDEEQKNLERYGLSSEFSTNKKRKQTSISGNRTKKKGKGVKDSSFDYDSGALARVRWFRVILDEAQTIKNHRTQVARACCGLRAKRRWCLSGTPIQNAIDDLYSYFRFLKYDPYAVYSSFCSSIKCPISRDAIHGYRKLQVVLKTILLRRTKGTLINGEPIVNLPPKSVNLKTVDFSEEERAFYLKLEADSRKQFKAYAAAGTVKQNYASILLMLLRLRQACDHPYLVKGYHSVTVGKDSLAMAKQLPREMLSNLLNQLEASLAICGVCSDPPEDAVVAMCGHVFCYQCISERLTSDDNLCPIAGCKDILGTDSVFSRATLRSCISEELDNNAATSSAYDEECSIDQSSYTSSKIRAALEILNSICCQNANVESGECDEFTFYEGRDCNHISKGPSSDINSEPNTCGHLTSNRKMPIKAIVFSQWTSMLDLLEIALNRSLIQYRRLDGTMSLVSRDRAVKDFNNDHEVTVMLMSLKAGNLGLNMVAACHVILLDLWWNPTSEDQAVDRAHRIGQTRPVTVSRLSIKDTVEDRILQLQEEKRKMVSSAFGEDQNGSHATRLTVDDLRYLFMV